MVKRTLTQATSRLLTSPQALLCGALSLFLPGCVREPLPAPTQTPDLRIESSDLSPPDAGPVSTLLASGKQPVLDGITQNGLGLAYHDGSEQYVMPLLPGARPLLVTGARRDVVVSGNAVLTLAEGAQGDLRLSAWVPGAPAAAELDRKAFSGKGALAATADGQRVAYVHLRDLLGETGDILIRRPDGTGVAVSPAEMAGIDLIACPVELRFYSPTQLLAHYCQPGMPPRVAVADVDTGVVTALSNGMTESVEQMLPSPGGRVLWTNLPTSIRDPSALKSVPVGGGAARVLATKLPEWAAAQLTLSPSGAAAFYLSGNGALYRVAVSGTGGSAPLVLAPGPFERLLGPSPDGALLAVLRDQGAHLDLIDAITGTLLEVPAGAGLSASAISFSADAAYLLYLAEGDTLFAFPSRGPRGVTPIRVRAKVARFAPLLDGRALLLHDLVGPDGQATASVADVRAPALLREKDRGVSAGAKGWLVSQDRTRLVYLKGLKGQTGSEIYLSLLP